MQDPHPGITPRLSAAPCRLRSRLLASERFSASERFPPFAGDLDSGISVLVACADSCSSGTSRFQQTEGLNL